MKKIFISIMALAAFAACTSNFEEDIRIDAPQAGGDAAQGGDYELYAEVGVGEQTTKATYNDLAAVWEAGDQIALLQEHANYGTTFSIVNSLNIKEGEGTSNARFNGTISVDAATPRIYHIGYPKEAVAYSVTSELVKTSNSQYTMREDGLEVAHYAASASFDYNYLANMSVTVPAEQNGVWRPYMYGSTSTAVAPDYIGDVKLTTLTGAVAVRVFAADGTTPKRVKSITITADNYIVGTFAGVSSSKGSLGTVAGPETSDVYSTVSEENILMWKGAKYGREDADNLLMAKAQGMQPSTTATTQALKLAFNGTATEITATGLESIAADKDGNYIYYFNVAPASIGGLTITLVDEDGSAVTRTFGAREFKASTRHGYNITWDDASLTGGEASTWYDEYATSHEVTLAANTLYTAPAQLAGVAADHVLSLGVEVNGTLYNATSGTLTLPAQEITLASGTYNVCIYAKVLTGGVEKELRTGVESCNVVSIPTVTDYYVQTSYSKNGAVAKTNSINGDVLKAKANLSDAFIASNLVDGSKYTVVWSGAASGSATQTLGSEYTLSGIAHNKWGQYDCYVKVELKNGYVCNTSSYTAHVTGIPYSYAFYSNGSTDTAAIKNAGWTLTNESTMSDQLCLWDNSKASIVGSPKFHTPANISTTTTLGHRLYKAGFTSSKMSAYVGASSSPSSAVKTNTYTISSTNNASSETASLNTHKGNDTDVVLSSGAPYITVTAETESNIVVFYHYLHTIKIEYR